MTQIDFQREFVARLRLHLPEYAKPAELIGEILDISARSAYRKLSLDSPFTLEEITRLCGHYQVSLDEAMYSDPNQAVIFKKAAEVMDVDSMIAYMESTIGQLNALRNVPDAMLYYAARDLPLFFYFKFPTLGAFKTLVWLKDAGSNLLEHNEMFDFSKVPDRILELGAELNRVYFDMPTTEIWTPRTMSNVFEQIQYYYRSGLLTQEDALSVLKDVSKVIDERESRARENQKKANIKAELYSCDFLMLANGALAKIGDRRMAWVAFAGINFVHTTNPYFCEDYEKAFRQHANMGVLISGSAEKQRSEFFRKLREQVTSLKKLLAVDYRFS